MDRIAILFLGFAPALFLLFYGASKARCSWNDRTIWEAFFAGGITAVFAAFPGLLVEKALATASMGPLNGALAEAFLRAALPEEAFKLVALFYILKRYEDEIRLQNLITLALAVAVGFAAIENLGYLVAPGAWGHVGLIRAVTAVPSHALDGLAMGALLTAAVLHENSLARWVLVLIVPIVLHGTYDFPIMLFGRNNALGGILPAWLLMLALSYVSVIYFCNGLRRDAALADQSAGLRSINPNVAICNPRLASVVMFLSVPVLACFELLLYGDIGIRGIATLSWLPIVLAIDLFCTKPQQMNA